MANGNGQHVDAATSVSTELAIRHLNEELQSLYEGAAEGILVIDVSAQRFVRANRAICELLGYSKEELLSLSVADIHSPEDLPEVLETFDAMHQGNLKCARSIPCLRKDDRIVHTDVVVNHIGCHPQPMMVCFYRDVTEQNRTIELLRESESKLRSLFENLPDLVVTIDRNAHVHFVNRSTPQIDREMLLGADGFSFIAPEHQKVCHNALNQAFATGQPQTAELQDIFGHWWSSRLVPLDMQGDNDLAMMICADITQERLATEAVNKEQRLLRQLLELHERERRLIAYEIHDGFAQQLTGALFRMQAFREMQSHKAEKAWENFDSALLLISRAIDETRRLISGLRPPILDESGIVEAVEYLICEHERRGGPKIEFVRDVAFERLAPPLESAIFRIVQESLQNACRHSRSDTIRVDLTQRGNRIHVDVRDWGVGFSPETVEEQRFGLQGIRERVRLLDGHVVIESALGKGTHIAVDLPFVDGAASSETASTIDNSGLVQL